MEQMEDAAAAAKAAATLALEQERQAKEEHFVAIRVGGDRLEQKRQ